ncbi:lipopolysaccharide biosynthesis protein [Methylocapsa sp. S129]|uniref:lipopolysaccharide biosynthesis protein n=1 Tax=Methylocapsa sp. S129 TaxID=1641869 RepID=UPI00131DF57B|nr:oligosaccharide flippase family protein [Methylocapsa sp. S129]
MVVGFAFASNALFNFLVGLLVAKFLGPAEFGRFAIATATAVLINTAGFDWIRLSAVRFYSARTRSDRPEVRATLDAGFAALVAIASLAAVALSFSGLKLPLTPGLLLMAGATAVFSALYDYRTALARARFHDGAYARTIIVKNILGLALTVGGAWWFASAPIALAGMCLSVAGALLSSWRTLRDAGAFVTNGRRALALEYMAYGLPLIGASILFQLIPLANRLIVSALYGFGETGQFSLANDLGVRILGAIASTFDVLLFQLAVRADETHGAEGAGAQLAENMSVMFAVILPTTVGLWVALPSFQALIVPEAFRGPFAFYLTAMLPGLFCYALLQYAVAPIFQIGKRTAPMIASALAACAVDVVLLAALPHGADGYWLALSQTGALTVGLIVGLALAAATKPMWPSALDILSTLVATAAMAVAVLPLRMQPPGLLILVAQVGLGGLVYGAAAYALNVGRFRTKIAGMVRSRA